MIASIRRALGNDASDLGARLLGVYALLIAANLLAWSWAFLAFRDYPVLLGTALLA